MQNSNSRRWTRKEIDHLMRTREDAVIQGVIRIYELQTPREQEDEVTAVRNGVGFNATDATFLSSIAVQAKRRGLTPKQVAAARRAMMKYTGQLTKIANGEL